MRVVSDAGLSVQPISFDLDRALRLSFIKAATQFLPRRFPDIFQPKSGAPSEPSCAENHGQRP